MLILSQKESWNFKEGFEWRGGGEVIGNIGEVGEGGDWTIKGDRILSIISRGLKRGFKGIYV